MKLPLPPSGVDVREWPQYIAPPINCLNDFQVKFNQGNPGDAPSGQLTLSESNAILELTLPGDDDGFPWLGQAQSDDQNGFDVVMGAEEIGNVTNIPASIENLLIRVAVPDDPTAPAMSLICGYDSDYSENLANLEFSIGETAFAVFGFAGGDTDPCLQLTDSSGDVIFLYQQTLSMTSGDGTSSITMALQAGKKITLQPITISGTTFYAFQ